MKGKFVKTSDEHTAKLLREAGLHELTKEGNRWVFVAEPEKMEFASDGKINYSDKLCF